VAVLDPSETRWSRTRGGSEAARAPMLDETTVVSAWGPVVTPRIWPWRANGFLGDGLFSVANLRSGTADWLGVGGGETSDVNPDRAAWCAWRGDGWPWRKARSCW
jgi:hypothetical protein